MNKSEVNLPLIKANDFVSDLYNIATTKKTVYAWGMFGSPITRTIVTEKAKQYPSWHTDVRLKDVFEPLYGNSPMVYGKEVKDTVSIELTVLRKGSKGKQVKTLQRLLNAFGYKLDVDGSFGILTESALKSYQKTYNLEIDCICGGQSWKSLLK